MKNNGVVMNIVRGKQMSRISCLTLDARHLSRYSLPTSSSGTSRVITSDTPGSLAFSTPYMALLRTHCLLLPVRPQFRRRQSGCPKSVESLHFVPQVRSKTQTRYLGIRKAETPAFGMIDSSCNQQDRPTWHTVCSPD